MRYIYISPHSDDAVFSAGGLIYEQVLNGEAVEIWNIMCGFPLEPVLSPFAQKLHRKWGNLLPGETILLRRTEDEKAGLALGSKIVHFDFLDCIYRRSDNGEWLYSDAQAPLHLADKDLAERIAEAVFGRSEEHDVFICPLSVGSHVDHMLVRQAMELLNRPLLYYVDVPYLFHYSGELPAKTAHMQERIYTISRAGLNAWLESCSAYESQIAALFKTEQGMHSAFHTYWAKQTGIGLWSFR